MSKSNPLPPDRFLDFVELREFTQQWDVLDLDLEMDATALQLSLMRDPLQGKSVKGTHGLRKMRFAPSAWNVGKSGACRVLYVYFPDFATVLLCFIYSKSERADIPPSAKPLLNKMIDSFAEQLRKRGKPR